MLKLCRSWGPKNVGTQELSTFVIGEEAFQRVTAVLYFSVLRIPPKNKNNLLGP